MKRGKILYIEDHDGQRNALKLALTLRGFEVEVAKDAHTARAILRQRAHEFDVIVIDMRLDDTPEVTGADVVMEFFNRQTPWPPEFLILSAFSEVDYFKLAFKLGAAAYLQKPEARYEKTIQHIRALVLRRALSAERPDVAGRLQEIVETSHPHLDSEAPKRLQQIVETSHHRVEVVIRYCREVMAEHFRKSLGAPFIVLLTAENKTQCCAGEAGWPTETNFYDLLQSLVFAQKARSGFYEAKREDFISVTDPQEQALVAKLEGAAFLPLSITRDLQLSLGILAANREQLPFAEEPLAMVKVLSEYFESAVLSLLLQILTLWAEFAAKRQEVLRATSQVCLYFGQEQNSVLRNAEQTNDALANSAALSELKTLSYDLQATGALLDALGRKKTAADRSVTAVAVAAVIAESLDERIPKDWLRVESDCWVVADREDLLTIISRVLQWFAQQFGSTPTGVEPGITVRCSESETHAELLFEDRSWRLDKELRARLFDPFAETVTAFRQTTGQERRAGLYMPLYLAKMLVELRYQGTLEDRSDEIEEPTPPQPGVETEAIGNRLVMRFRKRNRLP